MANIIVLGEVLFDNIAKKEDQHSQEMFLGGAPANCAMGITFLGNHNTLFVGGISTDDLGQQAYRALKKRGVEMEYVTRTDAPTRIVEVRYNSLSKERSFGGFQEGFEALYADEDIDPLVLQHAFFEKEISMLYTGSLIMAGKQSSEALYEMFALVEEKKIPLFLDVNMRPAFFSDEEEMFVALEVLLERASVIKISEDELFALNKKLFSFSQEASLDNKERLQEIAQMYIRRFPFLKMVLFTFGGKGSYAFQKNGDEYAFILDGRNAVDETGAGDAYCAGVIDEIVSQGEKGIELGNGNLSAIVQKGSALGAQAALCRGAICYIDK